MDNIICSNESFMELYNRALAESSIINKLVELCKTGAISQNNIFDIVPNISSTHGLVCGEPLEIKYSKQLCQRRKQDV